MAKYLDLTGLQTFWTKIKTYISNSVTTNSPSASKTVTGFNEGKITYGDIKISESQVTNLTTHLNAKAPLASPALTGTPTAPTAADGTNTTQIATTAFVNTAITSKMSQADAMIYKGTLDGAATSSTNKYGALTPAADKGATYKVKTDGYIDGVKVEVGDMLICNTDSTEKATASNYETIKDKWDFIQGNLDGVVVGPSESVSGNVVLFDGTTGKLVKDSGFTIGKSVPSDAKFTDTVYTHPTSSGNKHIPSGGSSGQILRWSADGTATWGNDKDTTYSTATTSANGLMSSADKTKLDGIATGANNYSHPTSSGNKHIPSGGSSGQILRWSADGTATWGNDNNTNDTRSGLATCSTAAGTAAKTATMPNFALATNASILLNVTVANTSASALTLNVNSTGAKPIKVNGTATSTTSYSLPVGYYWATYDGTNWALTTVKFTDTTYSAATTSANGLMSKEDKTKLNGIATGANNYVHPTTSGNKHIPSGGSSGQILRWSADGTATWGDDKDTTYSVATTSSNGLMSKEDKTKLNGIATGANNYTHPTSSGNKHIPSGGKSGQILKWSADGTAAWNDPGFEPTMTAITDDEIAALT